ncbi:hypothetical protein HNY73_011083 [Argiope bruennichi]|uniref:Transposase n=1 Tax=Argiope bruennichi TaxID=94029 RepID=A0A8T0F989_ARGBR|nr:hypothetical protein HNY73_011083 [Argiope bruennichi]
MVSLHTPESERSSAPGTTAGKSHPKRPKSHKSSGKLMASLFWDAHGILFVGYLEKGKTINSEDCKALLDRLSVEIKKKQPHLPRNKCRFTEIMPHATSR